MSSNRQMPTIRLRRLAAELRQLRTDAQLTREDVAERTGINPATLYRIERGRARPQRRTLVGLLDLYEVRDPGRAELLELLQASGNQGWLQPYHSELREKYAAYIGFETEARAVRNFESLFVPGLLQTPDYARAVIRSGLPTASCEAIEQRVEARIGRHAVLAKDNPLQLWAIMDEAALRRMVGGPAVMHQQMRHLLAAAAEPNVTVQIIPFAAGAHAGMPGSFALMSFPDAQDPEIIYVDGMAGDLFFDDEEDVRRYSEMFDHLRAAALSPDDSSGLIATTAEELK